MTDEQIKHMVNRFLGWRLPENFSPDAGISFKPLFNEHMPFGPNKHEPTGTNLFGYSEADEMVRYMLDGLPDAASPRPSPPVGGLEAGDLERRLCEAMNERLLSDEDWAKLQAVPWIADRYRRGVSALTVQQPRDFKCYECGHELIGPYCPACNPIAKLQGKE